jgi:hypothetical protein
MYLRPLSTRALVPESGPDGKPVGERRSQSSKERLGPIEQRILYGSEPVAGALFEGGDRFKMTPPPVVTLLTRASPY